MELGAVSKFRSIQGIGVLPYRWQGLRWLHASLVGNELAELESDLSVVRGLGNQSCNASVLNSDQVLVRHRHLCKPVQRKEQCGAPSTR